MLVYFKLKTSGEIAGLPMNKKIGQAMKIFIKMIASTGKPKKKKTYTNFIKSYQHR